MSPMYGFNKLWSVLFVASDNCKFEPRTPVVHCPPLAVALRCVLADRCLSAECKSTPLL
jgi:hypothetical protein